MQIDKENGKFITNCSQCIFAKWIESSTSKIQEGCKLNRLSAFKNQNIELENVERIIDGKTVKHVRVHTFCNLVRDEMWAKEHGGNNPLYKVLDDIELKIDTIIYDISQDLGKDVLIRLKKTVRSIVNQELKPKIVVISINNPNIIFSLLIHSIRKLFDGFNIQFYVVNNQNTEYGEHIDSVFTNIKNQYYCVIPSGETIHPKFFSNINKHLVYNARKLIMVSPNEDGVVVFQTIIHKTLRANKKHNLGRKIYKLAKLQKSEHTIMTYKEVLGNSEVSGMPESVDKVGIVITNHNYGAYVKEAIESCINQTYSNIIVGCIDDGSTDDSWETILNNMFVAQDDNRGKFNEKRTSIVQNKIGNRLAIKQIPCVGTSIARNLLIQSMWDKVDYFVIHDADDIMYPSKVEVLVNKVKIHPMVGVVYSDYDILNVKTGIMGREFKEPFDIRRLEQECIVASGALFTKKAAESVLENRQCFDPELHGPATQTFIGSSEDYDFWIRLAEKWVILHVPEALSIMRVHGKNESTPEKVTNEVWQKNIQRIISKKQARINQR